MTDPMCSVIAQAVVMQAPGSGSLTPTETVAGAILSDGTFAVAAGLDPGGSPWIGYIRVWHLAADLSVLGSLDIPMGTNSWVTPSAVGMAGNKVLLTSIGDFGTHTWYSWVIDCTGADPVVEHQNVYTPSRGMNWFRCGQRYVYDPANDRVIWAGTQSYFMLEVFRASTGESLCRIVSDVITDFLGLIGLHMDPTDSTKFIATAVSPPPAHSAPGRLAFTVALDGTSGSYDGITAVFGPGQNWDVAAGSPYLSGDNGILGEVWTVTEATLTCVDPATGTVVAAVAEGTNTNTGINTQGQSASYANGRYLISYNEQYDDDFSYSSGLSYRGSLACVDQAAHSAELLNLNYFGQPVGQHVDSMGGSSVKIAEIDVNSDGIILIVAGVDANAGGGPDPHTYSVLAWAVQGPSDKPNLTGGPLGVEVHFSGG